MRNAWGWWRWYVLCVAVVRVASYPVKESNDESTRRDLEPLATDDYVFDDLPPVKFTGVDSGLEDFDVGTTSKKNADGKNALLSLTLEPDAEMLPPNYKGVKPPGVDHMELVHGEPLSMATDSKGALGNGGGYVVSKQATQRAKGEEGRKKAIEFEKSSKGEQGKERKKTDYAEAAGKRKAHTIVKDNSGGRKDQAFNEKGGSYEIEGSRNKGHNAAGFRNVYHKDEYKKDADFYDNGHQGGHFRKHGKYGEKHGSIERTFEKGSSHDSAFDQAEARKEGEAEKSRVNEGAQGRAAAQGYDGFFHNFDELVKTAGLVEG